MNDPRRVLIVGSGPVGAMAAHELVRSNIPVLMLESGTRLPNGFLLRVGGKNICRKVAPMENGQRHVTTGHPATHWYVNMAPGGLSNQWTGAVPRFAPEDFTDGERLHVRYRWPLTYDDLAPYYETTERLLRITADADLSCDLTRGYADYHTRLPKDWQQIARSVAARGQGLMVTPLAEGSPWLVKRRGTAFNSYNSLILRLLSSPHFELRTGVHALRLELSAVKNRVDSVLCHVRADGSQERLYADAVIVACGALHSTKLLFDSACPAFPEGLGNKEGLLGAYLHDHPRDWWVFDCERPLAPLSPTAYMTRLPYADSPPLLATSWTIGMVTALDKIKSRFGIKSHSFAAQVFGTMVPSKTCFVRPAASKKDEFGLPALEINIQYESEVITKVIEARAILRQRMEEAGHRITLRETEPHLQPGCSVHYGGTTRMHESRRYGVLDGWNRLYDVPNVLVCDAGCFTTGAEKNPTLTAMALAARAADHLAQNLRHG